MSLLLLVLALLLPVAAIAEDDPVAAYAENKAALVAADNALRELEALGAELELWTSEVDPLLSNDLGRHIAASAEYMAGFESAYRDARARELTATHRAEHSRTVAEVASRVRTEIELYEGRSSTDIGRSRSERSASALSDAPPLHGVAPGTLQVFSDASAFATDNLANHRRDRERLANLARGAQANVEPAAVSLSVALAAYHDSRALEWAERAAAIRLIRQRGKADAQEWGAQQVAKEYLDAERLAIAAEVDAIHQAARVRRETIARDSRLERLRMLAESPGIQADYQGFLAHGLHLERGRKAARPQPASVEALRRSGALTKLRHFQEWDYCKRSGGHDANDRPCRSTENFNTPYEREQRDVRWQRWLELWPIWAEMGLLAP